ncbi:MAG TPA: TerB N-terminal domain-containing protein [Clostridia bacterium]|nr:TerB N-terminal domain-containing protein [Clostridia bacterium]HQM40027.1 TerB N-terminal domain-containing protein [Clostridia bacterium]
MGDNSEKKYGSYKIPDRQEYQKTVVKTEEKKPATLSDGLFYEIEYGTHPIEGVGRFVLKSQKIESKKPDKVRELFEQMRDISRHTAAYSSDYLRFFDRRIQQDNSNVFYKQGMFMKDFEDDFAEKALFSSYFPYYQMLNYEQLRTYFTWRTNTRKGNIADTSLSYVFMYIYELLNNIGVENPEDGLSKILSFWYKYKVINPAINKYVIKWLKDYHIYYNMPQSFLDFATEHNLTQYYTPMVDPHNTFSLFCSISKYDIKKSTFFSQETESLISSCFSFVFERIHNEFETAGIDFNNAFFRPTKKIIPWKPFRDALFHNWLAQPDKRIIFSENEIYICSKNEWFFSSIITTDKGKSFIGYVMKKMESELRKIVKYKYKLSANLDMVNPYTLDKLQKAGIFIEKIIETAVLEYYRESTKTIVKVDHEALERIRLEALLTQEALIVEEPEKVNIFNDSDNLEKADQNIFSDPAEIEVADESDAWNTLKEILTEAELKALEVVIDNGDLKAYSDNQGIMLEVLIDGINGKAMDYIGDNILDDEMLIYEDYKDNVKGMVKAI